MNIHVLHGIHTSEQNQNIGRLVPILERCTPYPVMYHNYGYALGLLTRFQNPKRAAKIVKHIQKDDICIGHSNGACLIWLMAQIDAPMSGAILINPALDDDRTFKPHLKFIDVHYNQYDEAVGIAKTFFLLDHPWGAMGRDGFRGNDPRVTNFDNGNITVKDYIVRGHSDIFSPGKIEFWGSIMASRICDHALLHNLT